MFSVVITCYNEGEKLREAVKSVRDQTFTDYELIVIKDFSDDSNTLNVCKELESEGVRIVYPNNNLGLSGARNLGLSIAKYDYIQFLDADDELPKDCLKNIYNTIQKSGYVDAVFGDYILKTIGRSKFIKCSNTEKMSVKEYFEFHNLRAICYNKLLLQRFSGYSLKYTVGCQDVELHLRLFEKGITYTYTPHVLYIWNKETTGMNSSKHNLESFDECLYEYRNFVAPYIGHKYLLQLLKQNKNKIEYCQYFKQYAPWWCKWATILPFKLLTKFARFVK